MMDGLEVWLNAQIEWSGRIFGRGRRTVGLCKHIEKELAEIRTTPGNLEEWIDVAILALDGAWRSGHSAVEICEMFYKKQQINFNRQWPEDTSDDNSEYEHLKDHIG